ncbi:MAG: hypothetical protein HQK49_03505 [Oligoflexia bacterium]|nr:hypothetical protein [Oligoflexia bacterium]
MKKILILTVFICYGFSAILFNSIFASDEELAKLKDKCELQKKSFYEKDILPWPLLPASELGSRSVCSDMGGDNDTNTTKEKSHLFPNDFTREEIERILNDFQIPPCDRYSKNGLKKWNRIVTDEEGITTIIYVFDIGNGLKAVFKPVLNPADFDVEIHKNEVAAYKLDKLLGVGIVLPTVLKNDITICNRSGEKSKVNGSLQLFFKGVSANKTYDLNVKNPFYHYECKSKLLRYLDFLLGNCDRHAKNYFLDSNMKEVAIDHGYAFYNDLCEDSKKNLNYPSKDDECPPSLKHYLKLHKLSNDFIKKEFKDLLPEAELKYLLERIEKSKKCSSYFFSKT